MCAKSFTLTSVHVLQSQMGSLGFYVDYLYMYNSLMYVS